MCCRHRTRSARGARLRTSCSLLTSCRLRMRCTLRMSCRLRMILSRASRSRLVRGGLILSRASRSRPVRGGLILSRASRSRPVRGGLILSRASRSRLVRGGLILSRASRSRPVRGGLILSRASRSRPVRGGLILSRASRSRPVRGGLILSRASRSRLVRGGLILSRASRSRLVRGGLILSRSSRRRFVFGGLILGCLIRCSRLPGRYHPMTAKLRRLRSCSNCRPPVVHGRQECVVATGSMHMLGLHRRWRPVLLVCRGHFCLARAGVNSTGAAVIADMVHGGVVDHGPVVNIVNVRDVHVIHRAVVVEGSMIPVSAFIADTTVAETVVDATVEADMRAPIALIPSVGVAAPTPVTGSPEKANLGSHHPRTGHPVVAFISISPVSGRPQITFGRGHGLHVHRERGRSDRDRYAELRERGGRYGQYQKS